MDNYKKMMDTEHREEVEALTNEWTNEQKVNKIMNHFYFLFFSVYFYFLFRFIYLQNNALSLMTADNENEEVLFYFILFFIFFFKHLKMCLMTY